MAENELVFKTHKHLIMIFNQPVFIICNSTSSAILHLTAFFSSFIGAHKITSSEKRQKINLSEVGTCKNGVKSSFLKEKMPDVGVKTSENQRNC